MSSKIMRDLSSWTQYDITVCVVCSTPILLLSPLQHAQFSCTFFVRDMSIERSTAQ